MWKWTDASQQIGALQHKKKFKYTRKVGNRYYYDDQKPTAKITGVVNKEFAAALKNFTTSQELADRLGVQRENMDSEITTNTDGSYNVTIRDKSTGKTVSKETITKDDVTGTASTADLEMLAAFNQLNKTKVRNLVNSRTIKRTGMSQDQINALIKKKDQRR